VSSGNFFDLWLAVALGIATFGLRQLDYPVANFILALILAPIIEKSFRRALTISEGDFFVFLNTPTSAVLSALALAVCAAALVKTFRSPRA
jgi:putative tricarboxylic transport membrane protein